jgi:hypothetical protein
MFEVFLGLGFVLIVLLAIAARQRGALGLAVFGVAAIVLWSLAIAAFVGRNSSRRRWQD